MEHIYDHPPTAQGDGDDGRTTVPATPERTTDKPRVPAESEEDNGDPPTDRVDD